SMHLPFDGTQAACGSCGQSGQPACDPATCPTRWDVLTDTATDFLTQHGTVARMGVAFYPALSDATITDPLDGEVHRIRAVPQRRVVVRGREGHVDGARRGE